MNSITKYKEHKNWKSGLPLCDDGALVPCSILLFGVLQHWSHSAFTRYRSNHKTKGKGPRWKHGTCGFLLIPWQSTTGPCTQCPILDKYKHKSFTFWFMDRTNKCIWKEKTKVFPSCEFILNTGCLGTSRPMKYSLPQLCLHSTILSSVQRSQLKTSSQTILEWLSKYWLQDGGTFRCRTW